MGREVPGRRRGVSRVVLATGVLGLVALVALAVLAVRRDEPAALVAAAIPTCWLVAALTGLRTPAPRQVLVLLAAVGGLHLAAFAVSGWLGELGASGPGAWLGVVTAQVLFGGGFVALATLLASYPTGRPVSGPPRHLVRAGFLLLALHVVHQALFSAAADHVVDVAAPVPAPWAPLAELPSLLMPSLLVLVVVAVGVLALGGPKAPQERGSRSWALVAGLTLATMLLASPAGTSLLGETVWAAAFAIAVGTVPFLLLAGPAGWRLGSVDRYAVGLLARGLLVVVVLSTYAAIAATASSAWPVAAAVTVVAALLGAPGVRRVERWGDRWLTGGRVRALAELHQLSDALATTDPDRVGRRTTEAVRRATGTPWCRLTVPGLPVETSGEPIGEAALSLPLRAAGQDVGRLECGGRPGGWGRAEVAQLERVAAHAALALRDSRHRAELADQVAELAASRGRLVRAEETVRRQVERDLHDGVQQQLVALLARLELARHLVADRTSLTTTLAAAHELAGEALRDLRALTAGIHPALLADRGLVAAVQERSSRLPVTVDVDADPRLETRRFPPEVEGAAYFVVAEALTNVVKHSGAGRARVVLTPLPDGGLRVVVVDEGSGTASYAGTGLAGLRDRVDALGGTLMLTSVPGVGTTVMADLGVVGAAVPR